MERERMTTERRYTGARYRGAAAAGRGGMTTNGVQRLVALPAVMVLLWGLCWSAFAVAQTPPVDEATAASAPIPAMERTAEQLAANDWCWPLLDRDGQRRRFCLAEHLGLDSEITQSASAGVYIQFGFMSCAACPRVAAAMDTLLPADVLRVYAHVDGVVSTRELRGPALWDELRRYLQQQTEYANYLPLVAVTQDYVRGLWESPLAELPWPVSVLIRADGRHRIVTGGAADMPQEMLEWWQGE